MSLLPTGPAGGDDAGVVTPEVAADEELPPEATSAGRARRVLREVLEGSDNEDSLDNAQLAISEIVTNALVHAGTAMRLRVLTADEGFRVELTDGSTRLPSQRDFGTSAPTGRGLLLVEELSTRWGAHAVPDGKVVWFEISAEAGIEDVLLPPPSEVYEDHESSVVVELHRMPLLMHQAWQEHAAAVLREVMLVRLDAELSALEEHASASDALGLLLEQVPFPEIGVDPESVMTRATEPRVSMQRLLIEVPRESLPSFAALDVMLDEALHLAEDGELLSPPTQPEIQAMRLWICDQVRRQAAGGRSSAWPSLAAALPPDEHPLLDWDPRQVTDSATPILAADDANRIVAVSPSALALLGYDDASVLVGRRLVSIIPERFHQAHVAGFTLHLINGRSPLLGRRVTVPALRRDGTEVEVGLLIEAQGLPEGRYVFTATFFE